MESAIMIVAVCAVFYFLIIRPENKRKKDADNMRNSLEKGDRIATIGGVVGKIVSVAEETIVIETSEDRVRMEFLKWAVGQNLTKEEAEAARKAAEKEAKAKAKAEKKSAKEK